MFGFGKKSLTMQTKEYDLIEEKISDLLELKKAEITDEDFLVAGGTSVFIKKYKVDKSSLSIAISDDGCVTITGSKEIIENIDCIRKDLIHL